VVGVVDGSGGGRIGLGRLVRLLAYPIFRLAESNPRLPSVYNFFWLLALVIMCQSYTA
jgi:hypothetical protein